MSDGSPVIAGPAPHLQRTGPVIAHLGLGGFHRAHQALYTLDAPGEPWSIVGVARSNRRLVDALAAQGYGYSVLTLDDTGVRGRWVDVHKGVLVAKEQPTEVVELLADQNTRLATLTITEKGYTFRPGDRLLDLDHPEVRADLCGTAGPASAIGQLAAGLAARAQTHGEPITLVSCDNMSGNGRLLGGLLREYAAELPEADEKLLTDFLDTSVSTPGSMVDRIVPATAAKHLVLARAQGYDDAVPVPAEPFTMWVLEDDFPGGRPAWDAAGVVMSDQVDDWFLVKSSIVNGTHSFLAYTGLLLGIREMAEVVVDPRVRPLAERLGDEYAPALAVPVGLDLDDYRATVLDRMGNHALGHTTTQVGNDGSAKLAQRVHHAVRWHGDHGSVPHVLALAVAGWLCCVLRPELVRGGLTPPTDPLSRLLAEHARTARGTGELLSRLLVDDRVIGGELERHPGFVSRVADLLDTVLRGGIEPALRSVASTTTEGRQA